jgi:hypothetical protein
MTTPSPIPSDPDLRGVPEALRRAADKARRLAEQTGTPFVVRQPMGPAARDTGMDAAKSTPILRNEMLAPCPEPSHYTQLITNEPREQT